VVTFLLVQAGLALSIETWLPQLRDTYYVDKGTRLRGRLADSPERPFTMVMLGSSRTADAFQGTRLEQPLGNAVGRPAVAFNFGIFGAGPVVHLMNLKRLLADGLRPDLILVEVLPPLLTDKHGTAEVNRLSAARLYWDDLPVIESHGDAEGRLRRAWWLSLPTPCYSHRFSLVSSVSPGYLSHGYREDAFRNTDGSGWVIPPRPETTPERRSQNLEHSRREYACYLSDFHLGGPSCQALRDLLALCQREDIRAALVLMPEGDAFRSWYRPDDWRDIRAFLIDLCTEFAAPLINAREWCDEEDFADSHHLLPAAAARFTDRLGREALLPLVGQHVERLKAASRL
jgi:hypothetical protein